MTTDWTDDDRVVAVLDSADLMFLAVVGRHGPHVTPLAFDRDGNELWCLTPRGSGKAKGVERDARVGILARHRGRTVIAGGRARLVDPLTGRGLSSLLRPDLPLTALGYLTRHERRVVGTVLDGPSPLLPLTRSALRIDLERVALLTPTKVLGSWGEWPASSTLLDGVLPPVRPDLTGVPEDLHALLTAPTSAAVLGWHTGAGPVALPGHWDPAGTLSVPAAALALTGALPGGPACLTVERSGARISSVRGLMLTGGGRARAEGNHATVTLDAERVTWWSGEDGGTVRSPERRTA